jgi:beta-N-acetylhexosaminidase
MSHPFMLAPFALDQVALDWVEKVFANLTLEQKLTQLFNLRSAGMDPVELDRQIAFQPGSITRIPSGDAATERALIARFNAAAPVPLLVSADLEGSRMSLAGGIEMPNPLALAAIDDVDATTQVSTIMATEARAYGMNWSFTPVLDINAAFRSAIVATRGFGSDVNTIERHALAQIAAFQAAGVAATAKHWPGEGHDDRDQHLVTTINPLSIDDWEAQFGRLYRAAIEAGVLSVMSAHIAFPAFVSHMDPDAGLDAYRPASISHHLNKTLLRDKLGFNGLIVSDATAMAGLGSWSSRKEYLPEIIASGCDIILFSDNLHADMGYLRAALDDGRLTWDRIDDAVRRQLATKAALGLHRPAVPLTKRDLAKDQSYVRHLHERAPTLVKDVRGLLPLTVGKNRRVLVISKGIFFPFTPQPHPFVLPDLLAAEGFEITHYTPETEVNPDYFDLILYLFGDETLLTRGRIFLDWLGLTGHFGRAMQRHWHQIPTLMISFGYPYLLYDAPRVPAYVNAYCTTETMQAAVLQALLGRTKWNTHNPVDPFCGLGDAAF